MTAHVPQLPSSFDPLIAEAKRRAQQRRLLSVIVGLAVAAAVAVGVFVAQRWGGSAPPASAHQTYSLVAPVAYVGRGTRKPLFPEWPGSSRFEACFSINLGQTALCTGIPVTGYRFGRIGGIVRYQGGTWQTPELRLVGTWNGKTLKVTQASPVMHKPRPAQPDCLSHETGNLLRPSDQAFNDAAARVNILQGMPCGHTYWFLVPLADHHTVSYLQRQFGNSILVTSLLQPANH